VAAGLLGQCLTDGGGGLSYRLFRLHWLVKCFFWYGI